MAIRIIIEENQYTYLKHRIFINAQKVSIFPYPIVLHRQRSIEVIIFSLFT